MRISVAVIAALLGFSTPAAAQSPPEPIDCSKASSTPEIAWCAGEDMKRVDAALKIAFDAALKIASADESKTGAQRKGWKSDLRDTQRLWLAYREKDCGAVIGWEWFGGTGMGAAGLACKVAKTEARTKELIDRYQSR